MTLSNVNYLPKAPCLNTIIRLSFYPLNSLQLGLNFNTGALGKTNYIQPIAKANVTFLSYTF